MKPVGLHPAVLTIHDMARRGIVRPPGIDDVPSEQAIAQMLGQEFHSVSREFEVQFSNMVSMSPDAVLKVMGEASRNGLLWESTILLNLPAGLGAPQLLAHGRAGGLDYNVTSRLPGQSVLDLLPGMSDRDADRAIGDMWQMLVSLHRHTPAKEWPSRPPAPMNWWKGMWAAGAQTGIAGDVRYLRERGLISRQMSADLHDAFDNCLDASLFGVFSAGTPQDWRRLLTPRPLHGDPHPGQFLWNAEEGRVVGFIDWEVAFQGSPILDFFQLTRGIGIMRPELTVTEDNYEILKRYFFEPVLTTLSLELLLLVRDTRAMAHVASEDPHLTKTSLETNAPLLFAELGDLLEGRSFYRRIARELCRFERKQIPAELAALPMRDIAFLEAEAPGNSGIPRSCRPWEQAPSLV